MKLSDQARIWLRTLGLIRDAVPFLTAVWISVLIAQGVLPGALVYFSKLTVDSFAAAGSVPINEALLYLLLAGICLVLIEGLQHVNELVRTAQADYFSDHLKELTHEKSVEVDIGFYETPKYHDLVEQVRGEASTRPVRLLESLGSAIQSAITLFTFLVILSGYGLLMPIMLVAGALPGFFLALKFDGRYHRWWKNKAPDRRWLAYFDAILTHPFAAGEVRLFGLGDRFRSRHRKLRGTLRSERFKLLRQQYAAKICANFFSLIMAAIALIWVAQRVYSGLASVGDVVVFYHVFSRGQGLFRAVIGGFGQSINSGLYLQSLFAFLDLQPRIRSAQNARHFPEEIRDGIEFRNVEFSYPGENRRVFKDFDLFIPAGKITAIVGVNGAGKSTLIKLLTRFYDVQGGAVEIDGVDVRSYDLGELRKSMSVLFQFPMQFHETAADSIALGAEVSSPAAIAEAARAAGAHDFISSLPNKYDTLLGKWFVDGCELSGGEWQRIALARAYYRRSPVVILDEPTSFMDPWSEADWFKRLRSLVSGRTGIVITHRFSIAMRADLIHVIDAGRLIESGKHEDLVESGGFYSSSWTSQQLWEPSSVYMGGGA